MIKIKCFSIFFILLLSSSAYSKNSMFHRRALWAGEASTYGAPTVNLLVDFINDCHYRMRFYYYMGAAKKSVIFGKFIIRKNIVILIDGQGNKVVMKRMGRRIVGYDNGYRIFLTKIR